MQTVTRLLSAGARRSVVGIAVLLVSAGMIASGCGGRASDTTGGSGAGDVQSHSVPSLTVNDLPLEYLDVTDETPPPFLPHCRGENLLQRYGEVVSAQDFSTSPGDAEHYITLIVVRGSDDLWNGVVQEVSQCKSPYGINVGALSGPTVGDESTWFYVGDKPDGKITLRAVVVHTGDYVFELRAFMSQDDLATLAQEVIT